jgi:formate dehydrogenase major subunit
MLNIERGENNNQVVELNTESTSYLGNMDYGTPESTSDEIVSLVIDNKTVRTKAGNSILRACVEAGIHLPKLCATDSVNAFGSCRLCVVTTNMHRKPVASCHTLVAEGMEVVTQSNKLAKLRKGIMELYISDHPLDCLTCPANGDCELEDMAGVVGLREVRYGEGENHLKLKKDTSNPYFTYDASKCILCSRCVRACDEVQGTFALTIEKRGFDSKVSPSDHQSFIDSECVSCGACVQACPTASLMEKSVIEFGVAEDKKMTTCAYCGVGCSFWAEHKGEQVIRMTPAKQGKANEGHSCVKGRFAWTYATSEDRITTPLIRDNINDEWKPVSWDEAFTFAANKFKELQKKHGIDCIGSITSSRCTNEETYLIQKLTRAAMGNNNVDTCARVCHSPTGYGLKKTFGTSAGTQNFKSVGESDVVMFIGANPTDAHPVFGSRVKQRLRQGAKLIVVDPRKIDLVQSAHIKADHHIPLKPGTNVAILNAMAHVIVKNNLQDQNFLEERCDSQLYQNWLEFIKQSKNSPEAVAQYAQVDPQVIYDAAVLYATGGKAAIYYGLGVTEHSQGSSTVMAIANLAMLTGNIGKEGVGVNPLRGQNNVQGACDMGSFPHEFPGYRHVSDDKTRTQLAKEWQADLRSEPGLRLPNMFDAAIAGDFKGMYIHGEDPAQSDPNTLHVAEALSAMECVIVQDLFLNETAKYAHVFFPGSSFLEKDGTFTNAERRISRVRKITNPLAGLADWEVTQAFSNALGYPMNYSHPSEIMDEVARLTPTFSNVSYQLLDEKTSVQWPCNDENPDGTPLMHMDKFVIGKGQFMLTEYVPTLEKSGAKFPLLLTTGRILSQYNVGTQTRRTENSQWHNEDILEINPTDAESRGISDGDWISLDSRVAKTKLRAIATDRIPPGVVYTTFHHPDSGVNVITTELSDWATNCPEYKVTAVQVNKLYESSTT